MTFDPKLSSTAAPVTLVGAANEQGPIANPAPLDRLTQASRDRVAQPVARERLLDENRDAPKPDIFAAISSIAGNISGGLSSLGVGGSNMSQAEKDNEVLKPLASFLDRVGRAKRNGESVPKAQINTRVSEFIRDNPRLREQALGLANDLAGVGSLVPQQNNIQDIETQNIEKYLTSTPHGALTASQAQGLSGQEQPFFIRKRFLEYQKQQATVEQNKIILDSAKADSELFEIKSNDASVEISANQSVRISQLMSENLLNDVTNNETVFDAATELEELRQLREIQAQEFRNEYISAGVKGEHAEERLKEVMLPIDSLITMIENTGNDLQELARLQGAQAVLDVGKIFADEGFSPILQTPEGMKALTNAILMNDQFAIADVARSIKLKIDLSEEEPLVNPNPEGTDILNPSAKKYFKQNTADRRKFVQINSNILSNVNLDTEEGIAQGLTAAEEILGGIAAGDDVLDQQAFDALVSNNLFQYARLATLPDERGKKFSQLFSNVMVKQMAINVFDSRQILSNLPAGFFLDFENNRFKISFNIVAFNDAEDSVTNSVRQALEARDLPLVYENIIRVIENPTEFNRESLLNSPKSKGIKNQDLLVGNRNYRLVADKTQRLNSINTAVSNIPTIENWDEEVQAVFSSNTKDVSNKVSTVTPITKEDMKKINERRKSYPSFDTEEEALKAFEEGKIKPGLVLINGETYELEG